MRRFLQNIQINFLLASILYMALGVVLILRPGFTGILLCRLLGAGLLLYGVCALGGYLLRSRELEAFRLELFFGVVAAALGLFFLLNPVAILSILPTILGVYVVIDSLVALQRAVRLYRLEYRRWWASLLLALLGVVLGVLLVLRPFGATELLIRFIGAVFLYLGISDLWSLRKLSALMRDLRERAPIEIDPIDLE